VAYKYFNTPRRKFIIADTPGHIQYTRNMFTGASNASLAILLVDARHGIVEQTQRHSLIVSLVQIPNVVVCINKMDLVNYDEAVYRSICEGYAKLADRLGMKNVVYLPLSAKLGENVVKHSDKMPWYTGPSLLEHLETVPVNNDVNLTDPRFQVQYVIRPQTDDLHDYRGYAGRILSGVYRVGDEIRVLPSGLSSRISRIELNGESLDEAVAPMSVILHLEHDIDISRGDTLAAASNPPELVSEPEVTLCWMDSRPLQRGDKLLLRHNSFTTRAVVREVAYRWNVNTLEQATLDSAVGLNDIVRVKLKTAAPIAADSYRANRANGAFILVDESSNNTVAACVMD
jgi:sulfate adenylyltransferase subunit 1